MEALTATDKCFSPARAMSPMPIMRPPASPDTAGKALKDIQVNGYTIPAGWLVMISPMAVHLNPELFEDPLTFNPWRWQEDKPSTLQRNFMPFGGGIRVCDGAEFSKVLITLFLHNLVTNYRWREIKGGDVLRVSETVPARLSHPAASQDGQDDELGHAYD